ncbi:MAG: hypothetical protein JRN06_12645 [Nitrososphaerota archaeon]|nr:hypothetical protein [Nitrososphaerota archaeon]
MQETTAIGPMDSVARDVVSGQSLVALLALVGTKRLDVAALRAKTKLAPVAFGSLLEWLQREYLVDVVCTLAGGRIEEKVALTEKGESVLVGLLERTCELPELR